MKGLRYIMLLCVLWTGAGAFAQRELRDDLRKGNRYYSQGNYKKAEAEYRKAFEKDSTNVQVLYNLGTTLLMERELPQATRMLLRAAQTDKARNALKGTRIFHNLGVTLQSQQQYDKAIEAYKQALRYNPADEETRYNLALCQKLLKKQPPQQNQDQNKDKDQKDQDKDQKDQQEKQKEEKKPQPQQKQENEEQMSKENARQLLEAVKQDEKSVKDRMNQQLQQGQPQRRKKSKDW